jgi:vacuolar-type H+-ATPase subunit E/Vma4
MTVERNERALIELVENAGAARRREILEAAQREADRLRREAHDEARRAMRRAFDAERHLARERIAAAQARLDTRRRAALQRRHAAMVAAALELLPGVLQRLWREPASRSAWIARTLDVARRALASGTWQVAHPRDLADADRSRLAATVEAVARSAPRLFADPILAAGIVVATDGARVDASLGGLLADREEIGGRLLARLLAREVGREGAVP